MSNLVSVIMPVRNEAPFIRRSLRAVLDQDYAHLEVIVADGMSNDGTREEITKLAEQYPARVVRIVDNLGLVAPTGLNCALEQACGDIVVRVDGHCVIPHDYVSRCVQVMSETGAACVGGVWDTVGHSTTARAIARAQSSRFGVGGVAFRTGRRTAGPADTVPFGAYRREIFRWLGTFDEELVRNQDDEFNNRIRRSGEKVWLDPSITSTYYSRTTLRALWRQYLGYGCYKVRVMQKTGFSSVRHIVPPLFVLGLAGAALLSVATRRPAWLAVPLAVYGAASLFASLLRFRGDVRLLPLLPAAYAVMHTAYGLGFLLGLWRWRGRSWRPATSQTKAG